MKLIHVILSLAVLLSFTACSYKDIPIASTNISINLTKDDVEILGNEVTGEGTAFTIFPFYLFSSAINRAKSYAKTNTLESKNISDADFLLESKSNSFYVNLIIFDYASSSIVTRGVKFKRKK